MFYYQPYLSTVIGQTDVPISLKELSIATMALIAVIAFIKGWVVPGSLYADLKKENNELRDRLDKLVHFGERSITTIEKMVDTPPKRETQSGSESENEKRKG